MKWSEEQLVVECLKKNSSAQKHLFEYYSKRMMGVCLRYTKDHDEAQDVLQMGFIKVFEKLDTYNGEGSLEGWIRRVVVNTALDNIRKNKKNNENIDIEKVDFLLANNEANALDDLKAEDLLKIIQQMPTGFRTVFNMYAIEGYSHKEIAEHLGITVNTSKSQYSRARVCLQNLLLKEAITR
jgi:RNA polymerase sigma-70 factor (ECF subfamily)